MDRNGLPGKVSLPKSVQEMSIDGDEPPQQYIVRDNNFGPIDTSPPLAPIPVIDISLFSSSPSSLQSSKEEEEKELERLRSALSTWGCFQVLIF